MTMATKPPPRNLESDAPNASPDPHVYTVDSYIVGAEAVRCVICGGWRDDPRHEDWRTVGDASSLHRPECSRSNPDAPILSTPCTCKGSPRHGGTW